MRRPDQPALTDAANGRVSMPFLPTLAVVALLGVASLYCPSSNPVPPGVRAGGSPALGPTDFAPVAAVASPIRPPAAIAFAEQYPLDAAVSRTGALPVRPATTARATSHVAVAGRRPCPGRRCPEPPRSPIDPMTPGRAEAAEPAEDALLPGRALPFATSVVETLVPAARAVGDAADFVRKGAASVQGSVALAVADCLR
ncbi:hypothetical protein MCBMB27_01919 [Methylobacterium phyllosphaerae]|uniref:Uncharacterized protein n=1 Tax=Methylobacterium phyllosphaerae TaxID=418223 RepID=A0AAE8HTE0_9HYPH|nr:hypothetical protein [Methylobacterium phyllosphaerae]APT31210.1 hypothetical protein MCBMB27_01919 [Methylobacterium phyllosphaerae]SFH11688.1 hypothetical protein SAMN05192567_11491 [Methylobacterium phyllosphaerae]